MFEGRSIAIDWICLGDDARLLSQTASRSSVDGSRSMFELDYSIAKGTLRERLGVVVSIAVG